MKQKLIKFNWSTLEQYIKQFLKREYRTDYEFRFILLFSQIGDVCHYLTHDKKLNPSARPLGTRDDERLIYAQALMQLSICINRSKISLKKVFTTILPHSKGVLPSTVDELLALSNSTWSPRQPIPKALELQALSLSLLVAKMYDLQSSGGQYDELETVAQETMYALIYYILQRGFSMAEVLDIGLQNQRNREWAITQPKTPLIKLTNKITGIIACEGMSGNRAYVVGPKHPLSQFITGWILVISSVRPEHIVEITNSAGVITDHGGKTSHAATLTLEHSIPCLVGTGNATQKIPHGALINLWAKEFKGGQSGLGYVELLK